nr:dihydrofolate reductase family protein [Corynebacterium aquatimens]
MAMNASIDLDELLGPLSPAGVPELRAVMVNTLFGSFTIDGTSGGLGNDNDTAVLLGLREWADAVLVTSGTVKKEHYGASDTPLAVVSRSLDFDTDSELFDGEGPIILTPQASFDDSSQEMADRRNALESAGAQIVSTGGGSPAEIVDTLRGRGYARISCEGGPSLYAALLADGLVDVLHLTTDPRVPNEMTSLKLTDLGSVDTSRWVLEHLTSDEDSMIFTRYRRGNGNGK